MSEESAGLWRHVPGGLALVLMVSLLPADTARPGGAPPEPQGVAGPLSPEDSRPLFRLDEGLRIELVAAEPLVRSPVAIAFDEAGRLWVAEMPDYPIGPPADEPPEGRIVVLEDRDSDGVYEHSTVFMESVLFVTGVLPWKGGAFVTGQFGIHYMKDTDGDGRADLREPLYAGSFTEVSQHFLNSPTLGFDNWIYVANGLRTETVTPSGGGAAPIDVRGLDFRFDPVGGRHQAAAGMGQFGMSLDGWGRRFTVTNRNHVIHVVAPEHYLQRNPHLTVPRQRDDQGPGGAAPIFPLSANWTTSILHEGTFTAACGITVYGGDLLGPPYRGSAFTADPTGNLVHQSILNPRGATFAAERAREGVEFLASPDPWFRPVNLANGPDGALYVVDMYMAEIEHPVYVPEDRRERMDIRGGSGLGRIWRIVPEDQRSGSGPVTLGDAPLGDLVSALESPSAWWWTTAQRLVLERQDRTAVPALVRLARTSSTPRARALAGWLLQGLGALDRPLAVALLDDADPRVREHALRLVEPWIGEEEVRQRLFALAADPDERVRFQLALSLGELDDDRVVEPLARIAEQAPDDLWTRIAVGSAVHGRASSLLAALFPPGPARGPAEGPGRESLRREVAFLAAAEVDPDASLDGVLDVVLSWGPPGADAAQAAALNGLAAGLERQGRSFPALLVETSPGDGGRRDRILEIATRRAAVASDPAAPSPERVEAVRLTTLLPWAESRPVLVPLLTDDPIPEVSVESVRALATYDDPEVAPVLLAGWRGYLPEVRRAVVASLSELPSSRGLLLDALEEERIRPGELTPTLIRELEDDPELGARARAVFLTGPAEARADLLARYGEALQGEGQASRGRELFRRNCAQCHRVAGVGAHVGPDISDTRSKSRDVLLRDILDPSAAIDAGYANYVVSTADGEILTGFIATRSGSSLTLVGSDGRDRVVSREVIQEIRSDGISVMPEGFETVLGPDEMRDLIEFLKNWRFENR